MQIRALPSCPERRFQTPSIDPTQETPTKYTPNDAPDMQVLDPSEFRTGLAEDGKYNIETLLDDIPEAELFESMPEQTEDSEEQEEASKEGNHAGVTS